MSHPRFSCDFWNNRLALRGDAGHPAGDAGPRSFSDESRNEARGEFRGGSSRANQLTDRAGRPVCLFVPEHYEAKYAYPLIVWLHGGGGNERELLTALPMISQRNYIGLSFRGTSPAKSKPRGGYHWSTADDDLAEFQRGLYEAVCDLRRRYHVHSERVFLAGFDEGATLALDLFLRQPEWYGGAICLGGRFPQSGHALARFRDLHDKRVLVATGAHDSISTPADNVRAGRLLHAAGLSVSTRIVEAGHEVTRTMLRQIDHWIMDGICAVT